MFSLVTPGWFQFNLICLVCSVVALLWIVSCVKGKGGAFFVFVLSQWILFLLLINCFAWTLRFQIWKKCRSSSWNTFLKFQQGILLIEGYKRYSVFEYLKILVISPNITILFTIATVLLKYIWHYQSLCGSSDLKNFVTLRYELVIIVT